MQFVHSCEPITLHETNFTPPQISWWMRRRSKYVAVWRSFLASHASELQQLLLASGAKPVSKEEIPEIAETALLELLRAANGARGVMAAAEHHEHAVKDAYDVAVQSATDPDAKAILERQREDVEFGERVLRCLQLDGSSGAPTAESKS